jgi:pimeloyl-ACP methyl ester carboxylesterase
MVDLPGHGVIVRPYDNEEGPMPQLASFRSERAQLRFLDAYDALRAEALPADRVERSVETDAGATFVVTIPAADAGARTAPLILLPGTSGTTMTWYEYVPLLAGGPTIHLVDSMGNVGRSVQRAPLKDPVAIARWMGQVLDGLGARTAHFGGISQGGWISLCTAVHEPDRVVSLTLSEPIGLERISWKFIPFSLLGFASCYLPGIAGRPLARWLHSGMREIPLPHRSLLARALMGFRTSLPWPGVFTDDELRSITQPTYLQLTSHSEVLHADRVRARVESLMADVQVDIVEGACHDVAAVRPGLLAAALRARLDRASNRR